VTATEALRAFAQQLRDRAANAQRNADAFCDSGHRGEQLLQDERALAYEAAAKLAEEEAARCEKAEALP